ncbi:MAG: carbohydrate-binding protein [Lachnospiraceae bacterium]|nr:carbohydrate-binding protein [Lachnospiraceae bacterium]
MAKLTLKIVDKDKQIICERTGEDFVDLVYMHEYQEGDCILVETDTRKIHLNLQVDDALGAAFVYLTDNLEYRIPFGEKRICHSPKAFYGSRHYLYVEKTPEYHVQMYRNLALNPADQHRNTFCYPHASANVETRGESVFAAKNAIDGVRANLSHGEWPYESWGINRQKDAAIRIDFGRMIRTDRVVLYTRADFPHDSWWTRVTLHFSDGSDIDWNLKKSSLPHVLEFPAKEITWISMDQLIKADDPSPFPALSQIEVYGTVVDC